MHHRAADLISSLGLAPHPEGGHFRRVFRSGLRVQPLDARSERAALTTIYYLLAAGELSLWHRVASDEVWHFYEGYELELFVADPRFEQLTRHVLGVADEAAMPVCVVPAGSWQAARSSGAYTLAGCTVGPGFEFADFQLLRDLPAEAAELRRRHPELADFV
jgi:predicted cupin superfamily sugar epimerase